MKPEMKFAVPVRPAVTRMRPYKPPLEGRGGKMRLDFNENPAGCSPAVRRAFRRLSSASVSMYPEQETTRRIVAKYFGVRPEELLFTNGTDEALALVVNTFVEPEDAVLIVEPTFAMYRFYSELCGARVCAIRYDDNLQFPMGQVLSALASGPRAFFLANPNNPTGNALKLPELRRILAAATNTVVVIDEAYFEFCDITALPWIRKYNNLIVTRTFSKAAGLAGLRLGCLFVREEMAPILRKAQSPYPVNVAALAAAEAVVSDARFLKRTVAEFRRSRGELRRGLEKLGIEIFPSDANFVLMNLGDRAKNTVVELSQRGILIRDRAHDFGGRGYVRITVGTLAQTRRVLRELKAILQ